MSIGRLHFHTSSPWLIHEAERLSVLFWPSSIATYELKMQIKLTELQFTKTMCSYDWGRLVHITSEEYKNATITGHFGFVFQENSVTWLSWRHHVRKAPLSICFTSTRKRKAGGYKFFRFQGRFRKAPFSRCFPFTLKREACIFNWILPVWRTFSPDGLVWTVGLTKEIKLRFQIPPA